MSKRAVPASKTGASPERPRGGRARAVSELLPDVGRAAFRRFGFVQSAVVSRWAEIVGTRYAGVSAPESISFPQGERADGTLNLVVRGAHATMMQHIAPEIIERVNRFFGYGAIARVQIRQGDVPATAPEARAAVAEADSGRSGCEPAHDRRSRTEGGAGGIGGGRRGDARRTRDRSAGGMMRFLFALLALIAGAVSVDAARRAARLDQCRQQDGERQLCDRQSQREGEAGRVSQLHLPALRRIHCRSLAGPEGPDGAFGFDQRRVSQRGS